MLKLADSTKIKVLCNPSQAGCKKSSRFSQAGLEPPPNQPNFDKPLEEYRDQLDVAFVITPHDYHHNQAEACMEAGMDVLLEKPTVMIAEQETSLVETRNRTGRLFESLIKPFKTPSGKYQGLHLHPS